MTGHIKVAGLMVACALLLPASGLADTQNSHRAHKVKKQEPPPPLPSGTQGPVPQIPLDAIPAVPPQVSYQDGLLTIVAPNSSLGDILRSVRKNTSADIEIPATANERVATHLGPAPAREVMAELLNGSHFNYILLGSPENSNLLVRVVLVAKTPDAPAPTAVAANGVPAPQVTPPGADVAETEAVDDTPDDATDQSAEAEQQQAVPQDQQGGVKTPQQMLQEMQQRQLQLQQQQQQTGQPGQSVYPPPGLPFPQRPQPPPQQEPQPQQ